jgi:hypothetical protein
MTLLAIGLALLSAVSLAYGALLQHRGVSGVATEPGPLRLRTILRLLGSPYWVTGLLTLGAGVVANVIALSLAPVMVVQPVGAFSLVISILLGALHRGLSIDRSIVAAVAVCVVGVTGFVTVSALVATSSPTSGREAHVLALLALACTVVALVGILTIRHPRQLLLISGAGVLFAFCATNMHVVSSHIVATGLGAGLASLPWLNAIALAASGLVGSWLVQSSYSAGPPEMVIAGLTVIDPIIAVVLGATLLGEAADAAVLPLLGMTLFGVLACAAVVVLSKHHPDAVEAEARRSHRKHGPAPGAGTDDEVPDPARR